MKIELLAFYLCYDHTNDTYEHLCLDQKMTGSGDVGVAKKEWLDLLKEYDKREPAGFMHPSSDN